MRPRHYQIDGVQRVTREFADGNDTLLVRPTGMGKTIELAHVLKERPGQAIVMAHREELIFQNAQKVEAVTGEMVDIEMADHRAHLGSFLERPRIISASVQTLNAGRVEPRMNRFRPDDFQTLIIDEAHHAPSNSYRRVIEYFKQNPRLRVLGLTATPDRADELALGSVFDTVAHSITIDEAIDLGWLVDIDAVSVHVDGLDYDEIRTTAGDLNGADLERVMLYEDNLHRIASPTVDLVGDKRTLVFASSVAHAERLAEIFNRMRPGSTGWVCGKTPKDERKDLLRRFSEGLVQIVVNVGVLTEGFDDPGIEAVVLARPTKSRSLYSQMVGRGTRPDPGLNAIENTTAAASDRRQWIAESCKPSVMIVDFVGNTTRHHLIHATDILAGDEPEPVRERARSILEDNDTCMRVSDAVEIARTQIEEEEEERRREEERQERKRQEELDAQRRAFLQARAKYTASKTDPFSTVGLPPSRESAFDCGRPASDKQVEFLRKQGVAMHDLNRLSSTECGRLIGEIKRRLDYGNCSFKQAQILKRYGLPTDVNRSTASEWIDKIAENNWRRPDDIGPPKQEIRRY